jgi:Tol biopolymer transport system component
MRRAGLLLLVVCVLAVGSAHSVLAQSWKIAFNKTTGTGNQVFTINPDGTGLTQMTGGAGQGTNWAPCWSPGGQSLCFSSDRTGQEVLVTLDVATGAQQQVTAGPADIGPHWCWAPRVNELTFYRDYEGDLSNYGLLVRDMTTGQEGVLVPILDVHSPTWSPDGSLILYGRTDGVYVVPAQGGKPPVRVVEDSYVITPAWSPAGGEIVASKSGCLWVAPINDETGAVDWGSRRQLTTNPNGTNDWWPTWSPDGQYIAYESYTLNKKGRIQAYQIWTVKADGSEAPKYVTEGRWPEWSPYLDGQPPVAVAGGPYAAPVGQPVTLDGSLSADPDGSLIGYAWDFGDGSNSGWCNVRVPPDPPVAPVEHLYPAIGTYEALLMVFDNEGLVGSDVADVTISGGAQQPGVPQAGGPYYGQLGATITFDGSASFDPNGDALTYLWDFGDGSTIEGPEPIVTHVYTARGDYTVALRVDDGIEVSAADITTAHVTAEMHISRIEMYDGGSRGRRKAVTAIVYVVDAFGEPVVGADVTGQWTWDGGSLAPTTHTTHDTGRVYGWTDYLSEISGKVLTYTVQTISKGGWTHDSGADVQESGTYSVR